ncbi:hypothetical protein CDAR_540891 [Caerostris darwini]|uniref:Secreted protein n=1 Tax=Caerostris darwini TaxID=1538125 RepID=A0AAV4VJ71_9ARAC|nr:hypothetical protein CDAR_540891 [Caerostris darwini]
MQLCSSRNTCLGINMRFWLRFSSLFSFVALSLVRGLFSAVTGERRRLRMGWKGLCTSSQEIPFDCSFLISHDYLSQVRWSQAERRDPLRFCHQTVAGVPWRTVGGHSSGWWAPHDVCQLRVPRLELWSSQRSRKEVKGGKYLSQ